MLTPQQFALLWCATFAGPIEWNPMFAALMNAALSPHAAQYTSKGSRQKRAPKDTSGQRIKQSRRR